MIEIARIALASSAGRANAKPVAAAAQGSNCTACCEVDVVDDEIVKTVRSSIVELARAEAEIVDDVFDVVHVTTKLERVISGGVGEGVGKLGTPLIGK